MPIILELTIRAEPDQRYFADARLSGEEYSTDLVLAHAVPLQIDLAALLETALDPASYGARLTAMVFGDPRLGRAWRNTRSYADALRSPLIVGLRIMDEAGWLPEIGWEMLCDPETGHRLGLSERTMLVRYHDLDRPLPIVRHSRGDVGQVIAVASPRDLPSYGLPTLPTQRIVADARQDYGEISSIVLDGSSSFRKVTLPRIVAAMRGGPRMLYLVSHGSTVGGEVYLWLEDEEGRARPTPASELVEALSGLSATPPLIAILACEGAGRLHDDTMPQSLGQRLMNAGVPAVLLFRDKVPLELSHSLMPVFWRELARDGFVARALGAARRHSTDDSWALPVLWTRVRDGHIWA